MTFVTHLLKDALNDLYFTILTFGMATRLSLDEIREKILKDVQEFRARSVKSQMKFAKLCREFAYACENVRFQLQEESGKFYVTSSLLVEIEEIKKEMKNSPFKETEELVWSMCKIITDNVEGKDEMSSESEDSRV